MNLLPVVGGMCAFGQRVYSALGLGRRIFWLHFQYLLESNGKDSVRVRVPWTCALRGLTYFVGASNRKVGGSKGGKNVVGECKGRTCLCQGVSQRKSFS